MHHAARRPELEPGSPDAGRARSPQRPRPPCPNPFLIGAPLLEILATYSKHRSGMVSNRSFLGHLLTPAHVRAPGHNCSRFPQPKRQIDTSRNLKSHLNHCKHNASLLPDRQNFGRISVRFRHQAGCVGTALPLIQSAFDVIFAIFKQAQPLCRR